MASLELISLVPLVLYGPMPKVYQSTLTRKIFQSSEAISHKWGNAEDKSFFQILEFEQARSAGIYAFLHGHIGWFPRFIIINGVSGNLVIMYTGTKRSRINGENFRDYNDFGKIIFLNIQLASLRERPQKFDSQGRFLEEGIQRNWELGWSKWNSEKNIDPWGRGGHARQGLASCDAVGV